MALVTGFPELFCELVEEVNIDGSSLQKKFSGGSKLGRLFDEQNCYGGQVLSAYV